MIDTSRRFYPVSSINTILSAMADAKFNVFHWHLADDDAFPVTLSSYPDVT
jgi:hexosaminidase